jgi:mRNA-degrading endonuclease RelE of RelBE toxin-antitoxin system
LPAEHPGRLLLLPRNDRADLLLLALPNAALRDACRELQLTFPGYRLEAVKPAVMADALAEEYETSDEDAAAIDRVVEQNCLLPPEIPPDLIPARRIPSGIVELLARTAAVDPEMTLAPLLWKLLGHPIESVRTAAASALRGYLEWYDAVLSQVSAQDPGTAGDEPEQDPEVEPGAEPEPEGAPAASGALRRRLKDVESKSGKLSADLETARKQLATERAQGARKDERLSQLKREIEQTQADLRAAREARAALEADLDRDTRGLLRKREAEVESLKHEVGALQRKLEDARRREADALAEMRDRKAPVEAPAPPVEEPPPPPAEPSLPYQVPEFTPEFYESIEEWDDRVVKSTFEKVLLLATNFAHPSLDAKLMQGAEGLYRIKIGTDVRLLYRRKPSRGIEVLSLIDRENLQRYVRQYKRRSHS